jgi:hypothetical protein
MPSAASRELLHSGPKQFLPRSLRTAPIAKWIRHFSAYSREGHEDTRRVVERRELGDAAWSLAQRLADEGNRLVVTNTPSSSNETAEVVHEALIRHWPRLASWINRDRAFQSWLRQIKPNVEAWSANPADEGTLLRGGMLAQAKDWLDKRRGDLSEGELAFIEASIAALELQQKKPRRAVMRTRIGFVAASILAVVAAGGALFGFQQADLALRQKGIAEQRGVDLENRKKEAELETLKAEQRSAMLAANVAQSFTEEGEPDQSLLLMLDAARVFDDASVPDVIRIDFTKALQKKERLETRTLFPNMQVLEADDALLLIDPATKDIWKLTDSVDPDRLVAGSPNDVAILKLRQSVNAKEYVVLRENLDVERIDAKSGARRKIGALPEPKNRPGRTYEEAMEITDDGLVVREFDPKDDTSPYVSYL